MIHPEMSDNVKEVFKAVENSDIVLVMCKGCGHPRPINAEYAAYVKDGIESCRFCRDGGG
jgi:nitrogen regulatory protein PII